MTPPSIYQLLQDFRSELHSFRDDVREDFKEFKDDVRRDSQENRAVVARLGEHVQELSLSVARLEEVTEENTPRPLPPVPVAAETPTTESKAKKAAVNISFAGLGSVALWALQKLWP